MMFFVDKWNNSITSFLGAVIPSKEADFAVAMRSNRVETKFFNTAITDSEQPLTPNEFYDKVRRLVLEHSLYNTKEYERLSQSFIDVMVPFGSFKEAALAARKALKALGDKHTELLDCVETAKLEGQLNQQKPSYFEFDETHSEVGYLHIATFMSWHVAAEARAAIEQLAGAAALILDLRSNRGGLLSEALKVYDLLVDDGELLTIKGTSEQSFWLTDTEMHTLELDGSITKSARVGNLTGNIPLVVLVNEKTASAAEVLALALEEHRGAKIVGMPTTGKNTAQRYWLLDCGTCLKITFAKDNREPQVQCNGNNRVIRPQYQVPRMTRWEDAQYVVAKSIVRGMLAVDLCANGDNKLKDSSATIHYLYSLLVRDICSGEESIKNARVRFNEGILQIKQRHGIDVKLSGELFQSELKVWLGSRTLGIGFTCPNPFRPSPA